MRISVNDMENYGAEGGVNYFSLKNDKDCKRVRFLFDKIEDFDGVYVVHKVNIDDKDRYVDCLREDRDSKDKCPLCNSGNFQIVRLYIPLYNEDEDKIQLWERSKKFYSKLSSVCSRYNRNSIISQTFDIERNGKAGDKQTTYEIYRSEEPADDVTMDNFRDNIPDPLGSVILIKSAEEMQEYLETGSFSQEDKSAVRNRSTEETSSRRRVPGGRDRF